MIFAQKVCQKDTPCTGNILKAFERLL